MIKSNFTPQPGFPLYVENPAIVNNIIATKVKEYKASLLKRIKSRKK